MTALLKLYVAPGEAFATLLQRPRWLPPLLGLMLVQLTLVGTWLSKVDTREFMKTQIQEAGRWEQIPEAQREAALDRQAGVLRVFGWLGAILGPPLVVVVVAAVYLFIFRFFYESEVDYRRSLTIVASTFLAIGTLTAGLTLLTLALKDDWNISPQTALQGNVSALLDKDTAPKPVWSLAESLDVFSFWQLGLLASGFAAASGLRFSRALSGVLVPWALVVLAKAAFAAVFALP
jgi:hypothetical protein